MWHLMRRSLLVQLLSVYLLFVIVVLGGGVVVNTVVEQLLRDDAQASDQALGQEVALETSLQLSDAEHSLIALGNLIAPAGSPEPADAMMKTFKAFQAARPNVEHVSWLDPIGIIQISWPPGKIPLEAEFAPPAVVEHALNANNPVFEVGIAAETTRNPSVIIADPVRTKDGRLVGIVAASLSLAGLSQPLAAVVKAQAGWHLLISVIDDQGKLIATPQGGRALQTVMDELPGADQALQGHVASRLGTGPDGQDWLFSAVPIPSVGWAVVVERPISEALAVVEHLHLWLLTAALIFACGGLLFWLILLVRVIRPLHTLAREHQALPISEQSLSIHATLLSTRHDEVGDLARSLLRLERDGLKKLGELRTLLETSTTVVGSLDPRAVVGKIIAEVRRLVDVQAAAVLLPDEQGVLRVLESSGHNEQYNRRLSLSSEAVQSAPVLALRDGRPVQKLLDAQPPNFSYNEGFRSVLALPIISPRAGNVVLLVHRTRAQRFKPHEVDLLLTFANYAALAWEHAVLYERSDERLREVAQENAHLYQQASQEKQKLEAIMSSMSDGLVLTGTDGTVLYANPGARIIADLSDKGLEGRSISLLYASFRARAEDREECEQALGQLQSGKTNEASVEIRQQGQRRAIRLRLFDVEDEGGHAIGRGLLLRDVTREREIDEFKTALLAAVGHEVRTPLAAIKGHASTLLQEDITWSPADQRHFLQTISDEADRLAQLVSNLLDLSRQEAGLLCLNCAPARIQDLLAKVIEGTEVLLDLPANLPIVNVDRARIEVVLHNLIANALSYGDGEVSITAGSRDGLLIVSVSDNGPGIAPDELPHIFERFYRARHGQKQRSGGTGLGLTICKAFIEAHGGTIWGSSSENGTTLSFALPVAPLIVSSLDMVETQL